MDPQFVKAAISGLMAKYRLVANRLDVRAEVFFGISGFPLGLGLNLF